MRTRIIAAVIIKNKKGEYLLLKMPQNFGAYPGQWGIVGGGIEPNENIEQAVKREVWEETGLHVTKTTPLIFADDTVSKLLRDGTKEDQYLIFLLHEVLTTGDVKINDEWETFVWVPKQQLKDYDLNRPTEENLKKIGLL